MTEKFHSDGKFDQDAVKLLCRWRGENPIPQLMISDDQIVLAPSVKPEMRDESPVVYGFASRESTDWEEYQTSDGRRGRKIDANDLFSSER